MEKGSNNAFFAGMGGLSDEKGRCVFEPIENKKEMMICASRDDYDSRCAPRRRMRTATSRREPTS